MKASEIILESGIMEDSTRGDATEMLTDLVFLKYGDLEGELTNGYEIDAILVLFDQIISQDDEWGINQLKSDIKKVIEDHNGI